MLETMKTMVRSGRSCVLATCSNDRPHCSLMAYVSDEEGRTLYMVTPRRSKKYRNVEGNPFVSLLIDTREQETSGDRVRALTVTGTCSVVTDDAVRKAARQMLLAAHSRLQTFWEGTEPAILCVSVTSFLLLDGVSQAHYAEFD
ncbi:MAG: pyridoxamine 5'-phosphate oxidase family protein [Desulfobacteraceae bacterium]|nr:pyridoxamine 5'-phosphate oxidase family protein [Desulfobacteraceae bacterium]